MVGAGAGIISVRANGSICAQRGKDVGVSLCQRESLMGDWGRLSWQ